MKTGWQTKTLGEVCEIIGGGTPSKENKAYYTGSIPWATVRDMNCDIMEKTEFSISQEAVKNSTTNVIAKGNVIIASRVGLGKVCMLQQDTAINQDLRGIIPKKNGVLPTFLFWWFRSVAAYIVSQGNGATVKGVTLPFLKSLAIPLPPLEEQKRIVGILDAAFEKIDAVKRNAEQNLANAKELFQRTLDEEMTPKDGWTRKAIQDVAEVKIGPFGSLLHKADYVENGIPIVNPCHMKNNVINAAISQKITPAKATDLHAYKLKENDIVFARRGDIGRCAIVTSREAGYLCGTGSLFVRVKKNVLPAFLFLSAQRSTFVSDLTKTSTGTTMDSISADSVSNMQIEFPDIETQKKILHTLEVVRGICKKIEIQQGRFDVISPELKQQILAKAFRGEL